MGIINVTPDSFSRDGLLRSKTSSTEHVVDFALKLIKFGADILDVGGESSRPGADPISEKEESQRIIPTLKELAKKVSIPISVDTYKPLVAEKALDAGASVINNIMGIKENKKLLRIIAKYKAGIVLMHLKGSPKTMQKKISYKNVVKEIILELKIAIEICLENGIKSDRIIVDPGIGFGKTLEHNITILGNLKSFEILDQPLLIGTSRKSFIGKVLNKDVDDRLIGSITSACLGAFQGAHILRVHDVAQTKEALTLTDVIMQKAF